MACREEEAASWTTVVPVECSEVASMVAGAGTQMAVVEEDKVALMGPLNLDGTDERKKRQLWRTWKNDKGKHHQECRDRPY